MNSNGRTVLVPQYSYSKDRLTFEPADNILDKGVLLNSGLEIIWNAKRNELSINSITDGACVMDFEVHDGKLECGYFDATYLDLDLG